MQKSKWRGFSLKYCYNVAGVNKKYTNAGLWFVIFVQNSLFLMQFFLGIFIYNMAANH